MGLCHGDFHGVHGDFHYQWDYPLVICYIAIENDHL